MGTPLTSAETMSMKEEIDEVMAQSTYFIDKVPIPKVDENCTLKLDSLLPILHLLPKSQLIQAQGVTVRLFFSPPSPVLISHLLQHIEGSISEVDRHHILQFAQNVVELNLSDQSLLMLAPQTYMQLAILTDQNTTLFPSLSCLRILDIESALPMLPLCVSPALQKIDFLNIGDRFQVPLSTFLHMLATRAPSIENLRVLLNPPASIPDVVPRALLRFTQLSSVELEIPATTFSYIQQLGELPCLNSFTLAVKVFKEETDLRFSPLPDIADGSDDSKQPGTLASKNGFFCLRELHVDGPMSFVDRLARYVESTTISTITLTLNGPIQVQPYTEGVQCTHCQRRMGSSLGKKTTMGNKRVPKAVSCKSGCLSEKQTDALATYPSKYMSVIQYLLDRTTVPVLSLHLSHKYVIGDLGLSEVSLEPLLFHQSLEMLEISSWKILSLKLELTFRRDPLPVLPNFKQLHLPCYISLYTLRQISTVYPKLLSLESCAGAVELIDANLLQNAGPSIHPLQTLKIYNPPVNALPSPGVWNIETVISFARLIHLTFPDVEITTYLGSKDRENWENIIKLFRLCQQAAAAGVHRAQLEAN